MESTTPDRDEGPSSSAGARTRRWPDPARGRAVRRDRDGSPRGSIRRGGRPLALLLCGLAALAADRCAVATAPTSGGNVRIVLAVTGGLAGVDWQVTIDGRDGRITGDRCRDRVACDWEPGDLLATVSEEAVRGLADRFFETGFFRGDANHGTQCCDQFDYALTYRDSDDRRTVTGSDGTLPRAVRDLIGEVTAFVEEARSGG